MKRQHNSGKKLLSYSIDFNYLKIATELGRGHLLCICIQMILPAIWFCVENSNMTFGSYWNKDRVCVFLPFISFISDRLCGNSLSLIQAIRKAFTRSFWRCLIFSVLGVISWHFFLIELIQKQLLPSKECYVFEFYRFAQRLSIRITISEMYPANLLVRQ